jgi:hypothetical protein
VCGGIRIDACGCGLARVLTAEGSRRRIGSEACTGRGVDQPSGWPTVGLGQPRVLAGFIRMRGWGHLNLGVRHVLKRVTRRDQVFRLHAMVELLPCMAWIRQRPLSPALAVSFDVFVARSYRGFLVRRCGCVLVASGLLAGPFPGGWVTYRSAFAVYGGLRR